MLGPGAEVAPYADCLVVIEPQADGPVVGFYAGHPIAAAVVDYFGRRYIYAGVAARHDDGQYDFKALAPGEWIVEPGLIYAHDSGNSDNISAKSHGRSGGRTLGNLREVLIGWLH